MGFFDFIGDALGAIGSPFAAVIDAGTKLLGLPPVVGDALKIAVGAATGDVFTLMQGGTDLLKDLAGSAAETEYAPPKDEAYGSTDGWAPASSARAAPVTDGAADADVAPSPPRRMIQWPTRPRSMTSTRRSAGPSRRSPGASMR